jgi:ribulose-bisphosphate carboxylase large chain
MASSDTETDIYPELIQIRYRICAENASDAERIANSICVEQSVEMPPEVVPAHVKSSIAKLQSLEKEDENEWIAAIEFPLLLIDGDSTQFLNVLFGNISLKPGIQVAGIEKEKLGNLLPGPAFGIKGIRDRSGTAHRPLSCTALKPIGLSASQLAERAWKFTAGGIDIIKDDHGLANQKSAPFRERVQACVQAIEKGMQTSGKKTLYFPNITTSPHRVLDRYYEALENGADGVLVSVQLCGPSILTELSRSAEVPVMAHPSFSGSISIQDSQGIPAPLYYGTIWRALGADCVIYPNAKGRFSFTEHECKQINASCRERIPGIRASFPVPAGGIDRNSVTHWVSEYGNDTIFLIGGSLYLHPDGLQQAAAELQQTLEES